MTKICFLNFANFFNMKDLVKRFCDDTALKVLNHYMIRFSDATPARTSNGHTYTFHVLAENQYSNDLQSRAADLSLPFGQLFF